MANLNEEELNNKPTAKKHFKWSFILILVIGIIFSLIIAINNLSLSQKIEAQKGLILQKTAQESQLQAVESGLRKRIAELQSDLENSKTEKEFLNEQNNVRLEQEKAASLALIKQAEEKLEQVENEKKIVQGDLAQAKASFSFLSQSKEKPKQESAEEKQKVKQLKAEEEKLEKERKRKEQEAKKEEERKLKLMANQEINNLKNKLVKANEQNTKLEEKLAIQQKLNSHLENKAKDLYLKLQTAGDTRDQLAHANSLLDNLTEERKVLLQENNKLKTQISVLEKEKAQIFQEQGNANMQAKLFDLAVDSYTKSVKLDPNNAEVNYRLGLLYKHTRDDPKKSVYYFKRYLQLNPQAKNRKEVEYLIETLSRGNDYWKSIV